MIGKLKGIIESIKDDTLIIDVGGVGYVVHASATTLRGLPAVGEAASIFIETQVREDAIKLFGFATEAEHEWFNVLTTVNGVGGKVGLAILSVLTPNALTSALAAQDKAAFRQVSGVGPKLAERIIIELKDKVKSFTADAKFEKTSAETGGIDRDVADAISALVNLGYGRSDAYMAVTKVAKGGKKPVAELIRGSLRELSAA